MFGLNKSDAVFSSCSTYRYLLWRELTAGDRVCTFIGLNPSTANATEDDPTIKRCSEFSKRFGCSGLAMLNLFSYRATKPEKMKLESQPVGPDNDSWIARVVPLSAVIILAWGKEGSHLDRDKAVLSLLNGLDLMCLGRNKSGTPKHPLYVRGDTKLERF